MRDTGLDGRSLRIRPASTVHATAESTSPTREASTRLAEYQRNVAFVGFMLLVCGGALVYLTKNLSGVFVPLIWAAFTAMPLNALISSLDPMIVACFKSIKKVVMCKRMEDGCCSHGHEDYNTFNFSYTGGGLVRIPAKEAQTLLKKLNQNQRGRITYSCFKTTSCRRRVVIKELFCEHSDTPPFCEDHRRVNRLVKGWSYYIEEADMQPHSDELCFHFFLDKLERYPAILDDDEHLPAMRGQLVTDSTHALSYFVAGLVALSVVIASIALFVWLIARGAQALTYNVDAYVTGSKQFVDKLSEFAAHVLPANVTAGMDSKAREALSQKLPEVASSFLSTVEGLGFEVFLYLLYVLFWTLEPLPVNSAVSGVFKTYLLQKSLVCLIFAGMVSVLLLSLECPLWHVLFIAAFILNYVPEVGPIACFALMLPLILLDGNQSFAARSSNAIIFTIVFLAIKFVTGNIIEVQLYAKSGGDLMRMHPVVMLALMMLFEAILGITGMFMTVPVMAAAKYYMLSMNLPPSVLDPLLTLIEGSEHGPHMNFVELHRGFRLQNAEQQAAPDSDSDKDDATSSDDDEITHMTSRSTNVASA
eukprot:TRINITY_DN46906_c0_g1_i1.p1 TRINITY_DN46906_c0_g1~~TRINITY_DN46906_c0_g1_i1.p1  ORF type:complete len:590 (-),score=81.65 TRINITY_DN46906_c0_g1_i1:67-1836(-)